MPRDNSVGIEKIVDATALTWESVVDFEAHAVEAAVEVEGVDVGHARDVVNYGLDAAVEGRGVDLVLLRHF